MKCVIEGGCVLGLQLEFGIMSEEGWWWCVFLLSLRVEVLHFYCGG